MRYRHVVRLRRVRVVIICFWFIVASLESIWIWRSGITFLLTLLSEAFSGKNYFLLHKDFLQLRRKESSGPSRTSEKRRDSTKHSKIQNKSVSTACMQLTSFTCYAPWRIVVAVIATRIEYDMALIATVTPVHLNSSLKPTLYCWKIREVKQAVKDTIRQLNCFLTN